MAGHVAIRQIAVFGLDEHLAIGAGQDCTERMVAMRLRPARDIE